MQEIWAVGTGYVIAEPEALGDILLRYERKGVDMLCRAVILGSNADLSSLTESQRRRTEAILSRVAQRAGAGESQAPAALPGRARNVRTQEPRNIWYFA